MTNSLSTNVKRLSVVFSLVAVALMVNSAILGHSVQTVEREQSAVARSHEVMAVVERVLSSLKDAESAARGYLLSNLTDNLVLYEAAREATNQEMTNLKEMSDFSSSSLVALESLERIVSERLRLLDQMISDHDQNGKVHTETLVGSGTQVMRLVRAQIDEIRKDEAALLAQRAAEVEQSYVFVWFTLAGATIFNLGLVLSTYLLIRRNARYQGEDNQRKAHNAWIREGQVRAASICVEEEDLSSLAKKTVRFATESLSVPAANLYVLDKEGLLLRAGYGKGQVHSSGLEKGVLSEDGLIGRALASDSLLSIEDVPEDYFKIESTLGSALPRHLVFVPFRFQGQTIGLLEMASFKPMAEKDQEWLESVSEALAAGFSSVISRQRLHDLLEETQRQSQNLQRHQEELRATNEDLEQHTKALQAQQEELRQVNEELEQQTRALESQQDALNSRNADLEQAKKELEKKAKEFAQISQYKSDFLAKMSHELRTPLNSLMILATLLKENKQGNLSSQQIEFANTIQEAGSDLLDLINDILDLSKLEARKQHAEPEAFDVHDVVSHLDATFRPIADQKGLKFDIEVERGAPSMLFTDRQRLQQVLRNFLSNAIKFTERGHVGVQIRCPRRESGTNVNQIEFTVFDTGIGIPNARKNLIWEAFEQGGGDVVRKYGGTGLGLAISKELAHLLQGRISVESDEGKGSQFTLEIPIELKMEAPLETHEDSHRAAMGTEFPEPTDSRVTEILATLPSGALSVLIVEKDKTFEVDLSDSVREHGFHPIVVDDGDLALEILSLHKPSAVLLGESANGKTALQLSSLIKEFQHLKSIPVHLLTDFERQGEALRLETVGYLGKDVTIEGVRDALSRVEKVTKNKVKRVLIVEDDTAQRQAIKSLIQADAEAIDIVSVGSGMEAEEEMKRSAFDCIILDLTLKDMTGLQILERLSGNNDLMALPPVIVYTGKSLSLDEELRLRQYADSIIIKGSRSPERLLDEVNLFLHRIEERLPKARRPKRDSLGKSDELFLGRKILLVDDDMRNVFALTSALETKGFEVIVARNGLEALEKVNERPDIEAILMDIMMPKMNGFEAMRKIREIPECSELPIIALTAKTMKGEHEKCIAAGASDYLPKPVNLMSLLSVLKVWLPLKQEAMA